MTDYQSKRTPQEVIRERAKRHMQEYQALNPGSKPRPINNKRIGLPRKTDCPKHIPLEDIVE